MSVKGVERAAWVGLIVAGAAYELREVREREAGTPLSEVVRWAARTHCPAGRAAFLVGWLAFAGWFARHIVKGPKSGNGNNAKEMSC